MLLMKSFVKRCASIRTILAVFILLGITYSIVTPIFEASDELWHYPLVQWLSKKQCRTRIMSAPGNSKPVSHRSITTSRAAARIDTSDLAEVRRENPHVDNGVITTDGNRNLITHNPAREAFPWRGTVLAVHLVRFISVLLGAATVWLTYRIALELFPDREWLALSAAAINAFTPMFIFISGAVNNDNLTMTFAFAGATADGEEIADCGGSKARGIWVIVAGQWLPLGIVLGLGALTKTSALALLPIAALAISVAAWRKASWWSFLQAALRQPCPCC